MIQVTYELEDNKEFFDIDPQTGIITTKVKFDRETRDSYNVKVIAKDGAPSSRSTDGQPNIGEVFSLWLKSECQMMNLYVEDKLYLFLYYL